MQKNLKNLPLNDLRQRWAIAWGLKPHARMGRTMLEKSLVYKIAEEEGMGLTQDQRKRLRQLIKQYRRNPNCFDQRQGNLKPGTRLVRDYKGVRHSVLVTASGFEYNEKPYNSLSKIASEITGTRWNGWLFFGLKNKGAT